MSRSPSGRPATVRCCPTGLGAQLRTFAAKAPVTPEGEPAETAQDGDYAVAISWTALTPGRTADAIFLLNRARTFDEFGRRRALRGSRPEPHLRGYFREHRLPGPGKIPVRGKGDGRWPAPGWTPTTTGRICLSRSCPPSSTLIRGSLSPPTRRWWTQYPHLLTTDWDYGYRSQRVVTLLEAAIADGGLTVEDMVDIQLDNENSGARALVPYLVEVDVEGLPRRPGAARRLGLPAGR